ncbi:MAG: trypsin-like peptidase domain-containing protein [Planctomycetes bacterium]|nr:trypsin-like peptidase domain-containing protein [Planctomycetota bacterium]
MIPGVTFEEITNTLEASFDRDDLDMMLRKRMSEKLGNITGQNTALSKAIFDLVSWAERRGRTTELIRAAYNYNPTQPDLVGLYQKYGMGTEATLLQAGQQATAGRVTELNFEKTIKARIPQLDFSVWRTRMTQVEGRVCRVEIDGNPAGTGFLVGPDAVITNFHVLARVLNGQTAPEKVTCRFDYKVLADNSRVEGTIVGLHPSDWNIDFSRFSPAEQSRQPDDPLPTDDELDYALVRLARPLGNEAFSPKGGAEAQKRGWLNLSAGPLVFEPKSALMIAQHPDGSPLKLAVDTESVIGTNPNGTRVRYATNTEPGSSGSPVFDLDWNLVALHHMGDPAANLPPTYNQGIPIDKVRQRISAQGHAVVFG